MELEDAGLFGLGQDCFNVDLRDPRSTSLQKTKEEEGSARASPVAAPMLKSESYREREEGMFRLPSIGV